MEWAGLRRPTLCDFRQGLLSPAIDALVRVTTLLDMKCSRDYVAYAAVQDAMAREALLDSYHNTTTRM